MMMESGRRRKCVVMCTSAGVQYVASNVHTMRISLKTPDTELGDSDRRMTARKMTSLETGILVDLLIRSGIGKLGVVTMTEGMPRSNVDASKMARRVSNCKPTASFTIGSLGKAPRNVSGKVRETAMDTAKMDRNLKERVKEDFVVGT